MHALFFQLRLSSATYGPYKGKGTLRRAPCTIRIMACVRLLALTALLVRLVRDIASVGEDDIALVLLRWHRALLPHKAPRFRSAMEQEKKRSAQNVEIETCRILDVWTSCASQANRYKNAAAV